LHAHGATKHTGKVPESFKKAEKQKKIIATKDKVARYENQLSLAISTEDYEKAAVLRDGITELKEIQLEKQRLNDVLKNAVEEENYEIAQQATADLTELAKRYSEIILNLEGFNSSSEDSS
jgi:protein-arginine kinase activator protein McsA